MHKLSSSYKVIRSLTFCTFDQKHREVKKKCSIYFSQSCNISATAASVLCKNNNFLPHFFSSWLSIYKLNDEQSFKGGSQSNKGGGISKKMRGSFCEVSPDFVREYFLSHFCLHCLPNHSLIVYRIIYYFVSQHYDVGSSAVTVTPGTGPSFIAKLHTPLMRIFKVGAHTLTCNKFGTLPLALSQWLC